MDEYERDDLIAKVRDMHIELGIPERYAGKLAAWIVENALPEFGEEDWDG